MKPFRVFKESSGNAEAVKAGWSWPAALFSISWAPFKGLWTIGIGGLVATAALGYGVAVATDASTAASIMNLVLTILGVLFGFKGNTWRESRLLRRGFVMVGTVTAPGEKDALARFRNVTPWTNSFRRAPRAFGASPGATMTTGQPGHSRPSVTAGPVGRATGPVRRQSHRDRSRPG